MNAVELPSTVRGRLIRRPDDMLVRVERSAVERFGLRMFGQLAWHTVEPEGNFKPNWHIDAVCEHLEAVSKGEIRRLLIMMPPRHGKSLNVSVFWPAWDWIAHPERRFLFASYAQKLSFRDSIQCRNVILSPWYQARWGDRFKMSTSSNQIEKFDNDKTGYRQATSVDAKATGFGGDIVVVDDGHNVSEGESEATRVSTLRWWDETMSSRLNDPTTGAFVIVQQRVHYQDLAGHVLERQTGVPYTVLCLPAEYEPDHPQRWFRDPRTEAGQLLWPTRVPKETLDELKGSLGEYAAAAQLQQRPTPREGGLFKRTWFGEPVPIAADDTTNLSRGWDLAGTAKQQTKSDPDWTATVKVGYSHKRKKYIILDVQRWRKGPGEIRKLILDVATADGYRVKQTVPKDPGQAGLDQAQQLCLMLSAWEVIAEPPTGEKGVRAAGLMGQAEMGNVELLAGKWNEEFLTEIAAFPFGAHDDMLDAAATAYNRIRSLTTGIIDYYEDVERQMRELRAAEAERERKIVSGEVPSPPGMTMVGDVTTDLARALLNIR